MTDLNKAIELAEKATEQLQKSHVKQYTRQDGTVVQEHEDSRQTHREMQQMHEEKRNRYLGLAESHGRYTDAKNKMKAKGYADDAKYHDAEAKKHQHLADQERNDSSMSKEELLAHADHHLNEAAKAKTNNTKTDTPKAKWHRAQAEKYQRMANEYKED